MIHRVVSVVLLRWMSSRESFRMRRGHAFAAADARLETPRAVRHGRLPRRTRVSRRRLERSVPFSLLRPFRLPAPILRVPAAALAAAAARVAVAAGFEEGLVLLERGGGRPLRVVLLLPAPLSFFIVLLGSRRRVAALRVVALVPPSPAPSPAPSSPAAAAACSSSSLCRCCFCCFCFL